MIDSRILAVGRGVIRKARVWEKLGNSREEVEGSIMILCPEADPGIGGGRGRNDEAGDRGCCGESRRLREWDRICGADLG